MLGMIVRFIVSALVLLLVSWIVPGLRVNGFTGALIAAAVIAILGYAIEKVFGDKITRMGRVVIYFSQFLVPGYITVSIIGALLASLVIGIVDSFVPTTLR